MKKITILYVALLFSYLGLESATPGNTRNVKENIQREIMRNIECPAYVIGNDASNDVRALIQVDVDGKVNVLDINSANTDLRNYVVNALSEMTLSNSVPNTVQKFILVIHFKTA